MRTQNFKKIIIFRLFNNKKTPDNNVWRLRKLTPQENCIIYKIQ